MTTSPRHRFRYKSLSELQDEIKALNLDITLEENLSALQERVRIGSRTVGNAMGIHPMEGSDGTLDGRPDELTYRRWRRFGEGGAKLIWGEATAVVPEGKANPRQLCIDGKNVSDFERLLVETRRAHKERFGTTDDLIVGLQLTHSGRYSFQKPLIASRHPQADTITYLDKKTEQRIPDDYPVVTDDYLERLEDAFVRAAVLVAKVGFDFVDLKQCHTYLLNELLCARERAGRYGGSFENRTRFISNVLTKIRSELGSTILLASRINAYDGIPYFMNAETGVGTPIPYELPYRYGFGIDRDDPFRENLEEPLKLVGALREKGVELLNVSMGSPYYNMHLGRPFENKPIDGYDSPEHPLIGVDRHFRIAGAIQNAYPDLPVVGTGYSWLRHFFVNAGASNLRRKRVSIVAVGRGAIAYPDFASDLIETGTINTSKVCIAVSYCTDLMRSKDNELGQFPSGCVPRDPVYVPYFKEAKEKRGRANGS